ncbi:MAG: glycosyltransferase [Acidobacteriota bacterium]
MKPEQIRSVLILSPESPYPLHGGGQYRTASLIHYFAMFAEVDLLLISENGQPALLPPALVRSQKVIPLPRHGKGALERYLRNARRAARGVSPLIDRLSGLASEIAEAIGEARYDLGVIEHFWLAPYIVQMEAACKETVLDLHNVESMLHRRCAITGNWLVSAGHKRFSKVTQELESKLLPRFSLVLATSAADQAVAQSIAPSATIAVYPNALPAVEAPQISQKPLRDSKGPPVIVFSGNFEYHPNIDAVRFLVTEIWPEVRKRNPEVRLRLVGRGDSFIRKFLRSEPGIEVSGPVPDARPEIAAAALVIAPLRAGSGTRIKILEAWSAGRAVLATPLAAEGLDARDGDNIALAATAPAFSESILRLLSDDGTRQRLGNHGRRTFERNYTWQAAWKGLELNLQLTRLKQLSRYTGTF